MAENELVDVIDQFCKEIKFSKLQGSTEIASSSLLLCKRIVSQSKWNKPSDIITIIKNFAYQIEQLLPNETLTANIFYRVLKMIREECARDKVENVEKLHQKTYISQQVEIDFTKEDFPNFKMSIMDIINEFMTEIETSRENIAAQSLDHLHANELILTTGMSKTVEVFLKRAAKKIKFQVIVVESAPSFKGHEMAANLASSNIDTILITDSAVFAMMARVNKVIVGSHTITANGGVRGICGLHTVALAAKYYNVPLIVCSPVIKFSPKHLCAFDPVNSIELLSPHDIIPYYDSDFLGQVSISNPAFDYIPPELTTLIISNLGGNSPSYIYRLITELYSDEDYKDESSPDYSS